ncbi:3-hydroxyacyl-CoA dehydrogenase [Neorhizobium lilium]|uniref:3-hydroxyacyl-CoA dehydrogenase n=1 Tax=Neorhizobium lilium TaxID=2503024 RepID=A0A3S3VHI3_9HYPH|nr:3-hydroxyacyl-CoA dehydrogenase [Neorhizobium lilium]RWX74659.1 3-hydroxyacyl-CoA dehydrogenase [Neorhizobium lilium]
MTPSAELKIAVIGVGLIGRAWAITFARTGRHVNLWDPDAGACRRAKEFIATILDDLAENDLLDGRLPADVLVLITACTTLEEALNGSGWVQECGPEKIDVKRALFARLDELSHPDAILASSSSALLPSAISEDLKGKHRCLVAHPINPPYLIPAVEVVPASWTAPEIMTAAELFLTSVGQVPIIMKKEVDGFIMNRLQGALLEEAFRLVANGYASAEDVDRGIADGLALRWSFIGPFETIDLNAPGGIADYIQRYQPMYSELFEQMRERVAWDGPVLRDVLQSRRRLLPESDLADRQVWRDRRLMRLRAHKSEVDKELSR